MNNIHKVSRIAGVTFNNEDGSSRQELLRAIYEKGSPVLVTLNRTVFHNTETNEDENTIQVIRNGKILGWIPRTDIMSMWEFDKMVLLVNFYKNTYSGALCHCQNPTARQYGAIKARAKSGKIKALPEYDRLCYSHALLK